jgi:hypothetical protein
MCRYTKLLGKQALRTSRSQVSDRGYTYFLVLRHDEVHAGAKAADILIPRISTIRHSRHHLRSSAALLMRANSPEVRR